MTEPALWTRRATRLVERGLACVMGLQGSSENSVGGSSFRLIDGETVGLRIGSRSFRIVVLEITNDD